MNRDQHTSEVINRIRVWEEALRKSYSYLLSIKYESIDVSEEDYIKYQVGERWANFHRDLTINSALLDSSIIHFCSIFSSGQGGNVMSRNTESQVNKIRNDVVKESVADLGWTQTEFDKLFGKIKVQRDGLLAHYSGTVGDYKKVAEGIYSRKMVGIHLLPDEIEQVKRLISVLLEKIFTLAYPQNNT